MQTEKSEPQAAPQVTPVRPISEADVKEFERRCREQGAGIDVAAGR